MGPSAHDSIAAADDPTAAAAARFDAVLHPHTSLEPRAFLLFMALLGAVSFTMGVAFVMAGAWPVFGFFGLDVLLVYIAFRMNYRSARRYETVTLTDEALTVRKVDPAGRQKVYRMQPYWLRVDLDEPPLPGSRLLLWSHGKALEIGAFLSAEEKADFARALRAELHGLRETPQRAP